MIRGAPLPRQGINGSEPQYNERMGSHRVERVAAQLRQEISEIMMRDLKDPRIGMATLTEVKLSPDLRNATVKVSVVGDADVRQAAIDGLEHAKGFIRRELGARLSNLRFAPDLRFQLDEGVAYSVRVSQLLREVQQGESNAGR
jgi:ribosome-binding factor A